MHEVWITSMGIVSAVGTGVAAHQAALAEGRGGLRRRDFFNGAAPDPCVCGMAGADGAPDSIDESAADRANILLARALEEVIEGAGPGPACEADCIVGTTLGNMHGGTRYYRALKKGEPADTALLRDFLLCSPAERVCGEKGIRGRVHTVSSACGSAAAAIGEGYRRIRRGRCERVIAGGVDTLSSFVVAGFNSLRLVAPRESRPFDVQREGLNPGEGAALLMLESAASAARRGAHALAVLRGFGESFETFHHTRSHPEGVGLVSAMRQALEEAGLTPRDTDHLHLHGTGTEANDISEYAACRTVFGKHLSAVPACSSKPMTGHTFGAAAAMNAVFSVLSLGSGIVPATLFHDELDPAFEGLTIRNTPVRAAKMDTIATTAMGFGGESFALILGKAEN